MKEIIFNTHTDDNSHRLKPLMEELKAKGIRVGELNKEISGKEFLAQVRREMG